MSPYILTNSHRYMGVPCFFFFYRSFILFLIFELIVAADTITPTSFLHDGESLISSDENFELGFFSPGSSTKRYLGIWYKRIPETVVWVANRNNPLVDRQGVLRINDNGNLVLLNETKSITWSTNASRKVENPMAQLLDSGNLVLMDTSNTSYQWQSFDYPSDTLLPGMKLGWDLKTGFERYLTSWKSADDPSYGDFTYRLDIRVLPQIFLYNGSMIIGRTGHWNGVNFGGVPSQASIKLFEPILVNDKDEIYYMYQSFNNPVIMLVRMNHSGYFQRLVWKDKGSRWDIVASAPADPCAHYRKCSANSVCSIDMTRKCDCLQGFIPKSGLNQTSPTTCVRSSSFDCKTGDRFIKLEHTKLPDLLEVYLDESMSLDECKDKCLKNCSCNAYANSNVSEGGRGCLMWYGDLIDIRENLDDIWEQDIYIRVPASESDVNKKRRQRHIIVVSVVIGVVIFSLLTSTIWWKAKKRARLKVQDNKNEEEIDVHLFDLSTITTATDNFSEKNLIGSGGFGPVYKGNLPTGEEIAVKRLSNNSRQGAKEFKNEIILIAKLQHRNLVGLLGSCIQGEERLLIYEYMHNKSLDYFIFDQEKAALLSWQKRFDIIMGIAKGLLYLHQDSKLQIIHRDLKVSNILLDNELNPKISDFGLARIFRGDDNEAKTKRVVGTFGYMSPEYTLEGTFSVKSDVFSFGVLLLEIISGKKNRGFSHPTHHHNLLGHAWLLWNETRALELMDSCLLDSCVQSQVLRCIQVGLLCVHKFPDDRPAMSSVVFMLANKEARLPQPNEPGFLIERSSATHTTSRKEELHIEGSVTITQSMLEGYFQRLVWKDKGSRWDIVASAPADPCAHYRKCSANSVCSIDMTRKCDCLQGFIPKSGLNQTSPTTCVRSSSLDCKTGDRFIKLEHTKLPDLLEVYLNESMSLDECKDKCLKNCSCNAYANSNVSEGGRGCLMWYGDLIDIRENLDDIWEQDIYIRVPASESDVNKKRRQTHIIVVSVVIGVVIFSLLTSTVWWKAKKRARLKVQDNKNEEEIDVHLFDLSTITTATDNFSEKNLIGSGGFGPVYKGNLPTGEEIAVKRLSNNSRQGAKEFKNEIILIAKLQHRNLVGLLGSCIQGEERLLIYEYMHNKSLDYFIFDQEKAALLSWQKRFDIIMGIAKGLLYLHQDSKLQIIHRDLKVSNILLDNELNPKISDFGLARIFRGDDNEAKTKRVVGTFGYMSPEYTLEGIFSVKSDVFSFGVLLLEIISGKKNRGFSHPAHHHNLLGHAWLLWNERRALELMDSCLLDSCVQSQVLRCIQVGLLCVHKFPDDRPAMSSVVFMLANKEARLPQPNEPGFLIERSSATHTTSRKEELHTEGSVTITQSMLEGR